MDSSSTAVSSRLIGLILVQKGLVTDEQLERALQMQSDTGERLGEIVVKEFGVARLELASVLAEQWAEFERVDREAENGDASASAAGQVEAPAPAPLAGEVAEPVIRRPIGEIFVESGFVTNEQLQAALDIQRETGARVGEILVEQGSMTRIDLASALADQWSSLQKLRPPEPAPAPTPWQYAAPATPGATSSPQPELPSGFADTLAELDARVRMVERVAAAAPGMEDLQVLASKLEAAIEGIEQESGEGDPAAFSAAIEELRTELGEPLRRVAELEAKLDEATPSAELQELRVRIEEVAAQPDLADRIEALRGELDALAARPDQGAGESSQAEVAALSQRVEELAGLGVRFDELAARSPGDEVVAELRTSFAELAAKIDERAGEEPPPSAEVAALRARVDEIAARPDPDERFDAIRRELDELAARADATSSEPVADSSAGLAELAEQLEQLAGSIPTARVEELESRLKAVEEQGHPEPDPEAVGRLAASLEEHRQAVDLRLGEMAAKASDADIDGAAVAELRARVEELSAGADASAMAELTERLSAIEARVTAGDPLTELREEMRRAAESTAQERASIEQALMTRVEEITATVPREDELSALRDSLADLDSRVERRDDAVHARLIELSTRLEQITNTAAAVDDLRASVAELGDARTQDSIASGSRLAGIEASLEALAGIEERVRDAATRAVAEQRTEAVDGLDEALRRLESLSEIEARVNTIAEDLAGRPDVHVVEHAAEALRSELRTAQARGEQVAADLATRIDGVEGDARARVDHDELAAAIGEHAASLRLELERAHRAAEERAGAFEARLASFAGRGAIEELSSRLDAAEQADAEVAQNVAAASQELAANLDRSLASIREELAIRESRLDDRFSQQESANGALAAQIEALRAIAAGWQTGVEPLVQERIDELAGRLADQIAGVDTRIDERTGALGVELSSLGRRVDELLGLHHQDFQAAQEAHEALAHRVAGLHSLRETDAAAATDAAAKLASRVDSLAKALREQAAGAEAASERIVARLDELEGVRADDAESARIAGAELAARLDDLAVRSAAAALDAEHALRDEIIGVAARLEERDADGIEAREALRVELERVASSVGWRLERIEASLAAEETAELRASVAELERRLDGQIAVGDEQVRVTERALRKGLASLGERLAESESTYVEAGNALRRSIERLGAAVVEADERIATRDDAPARFAGQTAYVAFAPTDDGYRMVELEGEPPVVGAEVEVPDVDGLLVVTRVGTSPLPLDRRACAYLERP